MDPPPSVKDILIFEVMFTFFSPCNRQCSGHTFVSGQSGQPLLRVWRSRVQRQDLQREAQKGNFVKITSLTYCL